MIASVNCQQAEVSRHLRLQNGFSLVEVVVAVLLLGISVGGILVTLQMAFGMVEQSRDQTMAAQFLQAEIETLRLKNWTELNTLPAEEKFQVHGEFGAEIGQRFTCTRRIETVRSDVAIKRVVVTANWTTANGVQRELVYKTRISRNGINDYYYRTLPPE